MLASIVSTKSPQKATESIEDKLAERPPGYNPDGSVAYVIHKILPSDTLDGISIRYNVAKNMI